MVTGLFGKQTDVVAQRHEQIVNMLNGIRQDVARLQDSVDAIDKEIRIVQANQERIIQNQQAIHRTILELATDIDNKHREVLSELKFIGGEVYSARLALGALLNKDSFQCVKARDLLRQEGVDSPLALGWHNTWLAGDAGSQAATCLQGLENNVTSPTVILERGANLFAMRLNPGWDDDNGHHAQDWIKQIYRPMSAVVFENAVFGPFRLGPEAKLASLTSPIGTVHDLETKLSDLAAAEQPLPERLQRVLHNRPPVPDKEAPSKGKAVTSNPEQQVAQLLKEPLAPELIVSTVEHLLRFYPLWEVGNRTGNRVKLLPTRALLAGKSRDTFGRSQLYYALATVDIAIAQQNVLSGDLLLPWFYAKLLETKSSARGDCHRDVNPPAASCGYDSLASLLLDVRDEGQVVHSLEALRRNLVTFIMMKARRADRWSSIGYDFLLKGTSPAGFYHMFGEDFEFTKVRGTWCLQLPAPTGMYPIQVPLPTVDVLEQQRLPSAPMVLELLSLRESLIEAIAEFDVAKPGYTYATLVNAASLLQFTTSKAE